VSEPASIQTIYRIPDLLNLQHREWGFSNFCV